MWGALEVPPPLRIDCAVFLALDLKKKMRRVILPSISPAKASLTKIRNGLPQQPQQQALLRGFLQRRKRDSAFVVLAAIVGVSCWLLWPVLFSLRVDGTTSMSWAVVWIPLWIADGIGESARKTQAG